MAVSQSVGGRRARIVTLVILLLGCFGDYTHAQDPTESESRYIRNDKRNPGVIVFVHGVFGDSRETWTNPTTRAYWPQLLAADKAFQEFNLYVYDYPSPLFGRSYSIDEIAENMRLVLNEDNVFQHRDVVFLAHSMGGLVTRDLLLKYRELAAKVKLVYFFATPTTGSEITRLARMVSNNPQLGKMVSMRSEDYLADQQRAWLAARFSFPSYCAYEVQSTYGQKIVEQQSATNLCNRPLDPINTNHIDIVKPDGPRHVSYLAFKHAIGEVFTPASVELPDWSRFMRAEVSWPNCPGFYLPPRSLHLVNNSTHSFTQIYEAEYIDWPEIVDIYQYHFSFFHIESLLKENQWIKLENRLVVTYDLERVPPPSKVDVVLAGECGAAGEPRYSEAVVILDATKTQRQVKMSFPKAHYYTLQPGEFEEFEVRFVCGSPGVYTAKYELPYHLAGSSGTIIQEAKDHLVCPESYALWDTGHLHPEQSSDKLTFVDQYVWMGTAYRGKKRKPSSEHW